MSTTGKRLVAGAIGLGYACMYGFWTVLSTGGGHVNFIWLGMFVFVEFFGLYFPLMAALAVDLRSMMSKVIFGSLILFNVVASSVMIVGWITEKEVVRQGQTDFERTIYVNGYGSFFLELGVHFLPTIVGTAWLIRSIITGPAADEEQSLGLDLS